MPFIIGASSRPTCGRWAAPYPPFTDLQPTAGRPSPLLRTRLAFVIDHDRGTLSASWQKWTLTLQSKLLRQGHDEGVPTAR